jgi:hypothetical protein
MPDEMAEAHARDYREKARIDSLRAAVQDFLDESERRRQPLPLADALRAVLEELGRESAHIVRRWD